jgi:hypothetical protein
MKNSIFILLILLGTGCASYDAGNMIVNNSEARLDVIQDGRLIANKIPPGTVMTVRPVLMRTTSIVATGYDYDGNYVGTDYFIFRSGVKETWTIGPLYRPTTQPSWK